MAFDHHSPEFAQEWPAMFKDMREQCPVVHSDAHGGFYVLSSYEDVARAGKDWRVFSTENDLDGTGKGGKGILIPSNQVRMGMLEMDPPQNLDYRKILTSAFSSTAVAAYEPRMRKIVNFVLDQVIEAGRCDIVDELAVPIPALVTLDYIGIPLSSWKHYAETLHRSIWTLRGSPAFDEVLAGLQWIIADLNSLVQIRRSSPRDDLIGTLMTADIDGRQLSDAEVSEMLFMLLNAGLDTTTATIDHMLLYLSRNAETTQFLSEDTERIPAAVEEFLRFFPPSMGSARTVVDDCLMAGVPMHSGDRVFLAWASANRDEAKFEEPEEIRLDRHPNPHMTFGYGIHKCIGFVLARSELRIILEEVLRRIPDFKINPGSPIPYPDAGVVNGFLSIPCTFRPSSREGVAGKGYLYAFDSTVPHV